MNGFAPHNVGGYDRGPQKEDLERLAAASGRGIKMRDIFFKPHGCVEIVAKNIHTGEERILVDDANLVVNLARWDMSRFIAGAYTDAVPATTTGMWKARSVSKMSWGTGGVMPSAPTIPIPPTAGDTALAIEIGAVGKKVVTYDFPNSTSVRFIASLSETEANGSGISEAGLWTDDNPVSPGGNILFARKTFGMITKTSDFIFEFRWRVIF